MKNFLAVSGLLTAGFCLLPHSANAQTISGNTTTGQTLSAGTLTVTSTGTINPTGNTVAVTVTGSSSINNAGLVEQLGTGRAIDLNTANFTLNVTNTGTIKTASSDAIRVNKDSSISLNNSGQINVVAGNGGQALDWAAIVTKTSTVTNTGQLLDKGEDVIKPGVGTTIFNDGTIQNTILGSTTNDGIDAGTNSGVSITNASSNAATTTITNNGISTSSNLIEGSKHGITGGDTGGGVFTMSITNNSNGTIKGDAGSGINIDGINANEVVTITNAGTITGTNSSTPGNDSDGVDVDGLVNLTNTGTIHSLNGGSDQHSEGVTVGGGTIANSGLIEGTNTNGGTGIGITLAGIDTPAPVQNIYADSTITNNNGGVIKGDNSSGIFINGTGTLTPTHSVTITNNAGATIEGGGATAAAIDASMVQDAITINNAGMIKADSSGSAIALGGGNDSITVRGQSAQILGNIDGGAGTNTMKIGVNNGDAFNYNGTISNIQNTTVTANAVFVAGGPQPAASSSAVANGNATISTTGLTAGSTILNVNGNLVFALGAGDANSGSNIQVTGGVTNTILFSGNNKVSINDLVGTNLILNQEYVLIAGSNTTYSGLQLGSTSALGTQIIGGLTLAQPIPGNDFANYYLGSQLYLLNNNIVVSVQAAPEPSSWLFGLICASGIIFVIRRRKMNEASV